MFDLLFSQRGVAFGTGYADVHAQLPVLKALMVLAVLAALLYLMTIRLRMAPPRGAGGVLPRWWAWRSSAGSCTLGDPGTYRVSPNEIVTERPYIDFNIHYTRLAYGLDNIEEQKSPAEQTLTLQNLQKNDATINNIRLWDTRPLLSTYSQLQEIRTYYKFTDIDIDGSGFRRRVPAGDPVAAGALRAESAKPIWINERLTYTHGYGAVVSPVNRVTREGLPEFWVKDIPPVASSDLRICPPELYFSELATDYVFVKPRRQGIRLPGGEPKRLHDLRGPAGSRWSLSGARRCSRRTWGTSSSSCPTT